MPLTLEDRQSFLAEPHIAALSVAAGTDRGPLTVPIWYQYTPGGEPWVLTGAGSRKAQLIDAAGRFTLMVERLEPTIRYVTVEGPARAGGSASDTQVREMAERYLPADKVEGYLAYAEAELGEHLVYYLRPEHWLSADMGTL
jgi:pyridoxamine 5'-phosphate oxidase-like protein